MTRRRIHQSDEEYDDDEEGGDCVEMNSRDVKFPSVGSKGSSSMPLKKPKQKGPMDMFFSPIPTNVVKGNKEQGRQKTMNELCKKELRAKVNEDVSKWFYDAGLAFHVITLERFALICESIDQFDPGLKPPSMYELRVPLLKKEVDKFRRQCQSTRQSGHIKVVQFNQMVSTIEPSKRILLTSLSTLPKV